MSKITQVLLAMCGLGGGKSNPNQIREYEAEKGDDKAREIGQLTDDFLCHATRFRVHSLLTIMTTA